MSIFRDSIKAVKDGSLTESHPVYSKSFGSFDDAIEAACDAILGEYEKRLADEPPPEVEAFSWIDSYDNPQVQIKLASPVEAFPTSSVTEKKRYWLIEIPEPELAEKPIPPPPDKMLPENESRYESEGAC